MCVTTDAKEDQSGAYNKHLCFSTVLASVRYNRLPLGFSCKYKYDIIHFSIHIKPTLLICIRYLKTKIQLWCRPGHYNSVQSWYIAIKTHWPMASMGTRGCCLFFCCSIYLSIELEDRISRGCPSPFVVSINTSQTALCCQCYSDPLNLSQYSQK